MSVALRIFHANPIVRSDPGAATAWELTLTMEHRSYDELSRLWQATTAPLRMSLVYRAAVVFIAPDQPPETGPETKTFSVAADPVPLPLPAQGPGDYPVLFGTFRDGSYLGPVSAAVPFSQSPATVAAGQTCLAARLGSRRGRRLGRRVPAAARRRPRDRRDGVGGDRRVERGQVRARAPRERRHRRRPAPPPPASTSCASAAARSARPAPPAAARSRSASPRMWTRREARCSSGPAPFTVHGAGFVRGRDGGARRHGRAHAGRRVTRARPGQHRPVGHVAGVLAASRARRDGPAGPGPGQRHRVGSGAVGDAVNAAPAVQARPDGRGPRAGRTRLAGGRRRGRAALAHRDPAARRAPGALAAPAVVRARLRGRAPAGDQPQRGRPGARAQGRGHRRRAGLLPVGRARGGGIRPDRRARRAARGCPPRAPRRHAWPVGRGHGAAHAHGRERRRPGDRPGVRVPARPDRGRRPDAGAGGHAVRAGRRAAPRPGLRARAVAARRAGRGRA